MVKQASEEIHKKKITHLNMTFSITKVVCNKHFAFFAFF